MVISEIEKLKNLMVRPETPIIKALIQLDACGKGMIIISDNDGKILGIATDGDIRRGFIKGARFEDPISKVMNPHPFVVPLNYSPRDILRKIKEENFRFILQVDDNNKIKNIYFIEDFIEAPSVKTTAVIMAGGLGTRLKPLTQDYPKALINVGNKPILQIILEQLRDYGIDDFIFSVRYKSDLIEAYFRDGKDFGVNIEYIKEDKPLGTIGSLKLIDRELKDDFFVMNCDILTKLNFSEFMNYHKLEEPAMSVAVRQYSTQIPYGVIEIENNKIVNLSEKPVMNYFVNAGIYILKPEIIKLIPDNEYMDITDLISKLINSGEKVVTFPIREYWLDIGKIDDYKQAEEDIKTQKLVI